MVTVNPPEDGDNFLSMCPTQQFTSQAFKIPIYCFGNQSLFGGVSLSHVPQEEEEQSLLETLLLAQWEDRMWKGQFKYDVTTTEMKVISGRTKFLAQLNGGWSMDCLEDPSEYKMCHQGNLSVFDWVKRREELLFCIASGDKACSELIPSASVPNGAIFIIINVNPIEYGHVFLVPSGFNSLYQFVDAQALEMIAGMAAEINNCSFRMFYDCSRPGASHQYFQACYFPDFLPVEFMPVDTLFGDGKEGTHISMVIDYPIKALLFERKSNCNFKIVLEVLAEICSFLQDKSIPYNLLITDCGKKIFLFLQRQRSSVSYSLSAWECGGYFLFSSREEFDQVTEAVLLKRLISNSLDDEGFAIVKQFCCSIASKLVITT